ncbi:pyridine nucleotide-disulfide oxidoreductase [Halomonas cupida]|uniref:Pyridine nucleotide-disulfide oxidoreductase n=1 Tax=Halomonas cupida TaxID=44933 RepID=A0A1M7GD02_9GAMM|nr:FAD-dependent oxidoreductase [Halomonas cupida]GEN23751.1 pyridine nucleotide-disulfide oxidoreductase [Halomonas cupida]SHM14056.1 rubredoxin-NAD+ reductase [Halomonas cupida]
MQAPLTIIGTGMAGIGLARQLRALGNERPITLITADSGDDYSKPLLSTGFAKRLPPQRLAMRSALEVADQLNAVVRTRTRVDAIDTDARQLLIGEERLAWSDLVLATGAVPCPPFEVPTALAGRIFSINDLDDYRAFHAALEALGRPARVAIIGLGLVGCEFANDLHAGGHQVTLVGPEQALLPRLLPEPLGQALGRAFAASDIEVRYQRLVTRVDEEGGQAVLVLDDGQRLEADLVLVATGLKPRTELAVEAGLQVGSDGIQVDRRLSTSVRHVHALGDVACVQGINAMYIQPLQAAVKALAATLNGTPTAVSYGAWPVLVKTPLLPVVSLPPVHGRVHWRIEADGEDMTALAEDDQGQLQGFALTGSCVRRKVELARAAQPLLG